MTIRKGRRKFRMGSGPLKPAPGPNGPIKRNTVVEEDNLPEGVSLAMELRALQDNWLLDIDTKQRQNLIIALMNKATTLSRKESLSDVEFSRLMRIFDTLSSVEQRQQRLAIDRIKAIRDVQMIDGDLPAQVTNQQLNQVNVNIDATGVQQIPAWQAVRQLLQSEEIRAAITGRDKPDSQQDGNNQANKQELIPAIANAPSILADS